MDAPLYTIYRFSGQIRCQSEANDIKRLKDIPDKIMAQYLQPLFKLFQRYFCTMDQPHIVFKTN